MVEGASITGYLDEVTTTKVGYDYYILISMRVNKVEIWNLDTFVNGKEEITLSFTPVKKPPINKNKKREILW